MTKNPAKNYADVAAAMRFTTRNAAKAEFFSWRRGIWINISAGPGPESRNEPRCCLR
jgi:hypothetical protein